jgi:outer membrane protein OmpA-like peptidoglycan-associated protein
MTIMKTILRILVSTVCIINFALANVYGQDQASYIPEGRYLVIGSFHIKNNAEGFSKYVKQQGKYEVTMSFHPITKFYHVYIKGYGPNEKGFDDVARMRKETEFIDTWFMVVTPYDLPQNKAVAQGEAPAVDEADHSPETKPADSAEKEDVDASAGWIRAITTDGDSSINEDSLKAFSEEPDPDGGWIRASNTGGGELEPVDPKIVPLTYSENGRYKLFFNTYYTKNFKEVKGAVEIINPTSLKLMKVVQSLELVSIGDPRGSDHTVQLISNIFGYKKVQHDIKLDEPFDEVNEEFFHFKGDTLVADFPLQRYDLGDIAIMYNVFFFKDAAIMKPSSKFEMNSLLDMLKENDNLEIKIHGHTNSNQRGSIITMSDNSDKFFKLDQEVNESTGSAKELSRARGEIIKRYIISYGISADRMEVIGWGGKKPIYDKLDKLAIKNVRVEIEIVQN